MPLIRPFRGWRYNPAKIKRPSDVLAPPYDVISKKGQEELYRRSPFNVVRLILGKQKKSDRSGSDRYSRARDFMKQWTRKGVLAQDVLPCVYVYVQDYREAGRLKQRVGFMAAMKIDRGSVLRHENTLSGPKKDRLHLIKAVRANLSPLFGLYEDRSASVRRLLQNAMKGRPCLDVRIEGVRHRLYLEERPLPLARLAAAMRAKKMYIADGHHRFEVTCQFRKWMRFRHPAARDAGWNYAMTYFADCDHNPFLIYPTHRLIRVPSSKKDPLEPLKKIGALEKVRNLRTILKRLEKSRDEIRDKKYAFGVYTRRGGFQILTLFKNPVPAGEKNPVRRLDVDVLHRAVLEPRYGLTFVEKSKAIDFTRDPREACARVRRGEFDAAFFIRPASLNEMIRVTKKGLKMPQKSTYFYPKLLSGLVFHRFDGSPA